VNVAPEAVTIGMPVRVLFRKMTGRDLAADLRAGRFSGAAIERTPDRPRVTDTDVVLARPPAVSTRPSGSSGARSSRA
jgi:hypothetical protein